MKGFKFAPHIFFRIVLPCLVIMSACAPVTLPKNTYFPTSEPAPVKPTPKSPTQFFPPSQEPALVPAAIVPESLQQKITALAVTNLANRLSVDQSTIEIILIEPLTWPNSALGCPQPGQFYSEVTIPGLRIRLAVASVEVVYHTDLAGTLLLCPAQDKGNPDHSNNPGGPATS